MLVEARKPFTGADLRWGLFQNKSNGRCADTSRYIVRVMELYNIA